MSRFSNPLNEPKDPVHEQEIEDRRADDWQDQAIDRLVEKSEQRENYGNTIQRR